MLEQKIGVAEDNISTIDIINCRENSWWKRRTNLELKLCSCTLFLMAVSVIMSVSFIWIFATHVNPEGSGNPTTTGHLRPLSNVGREEVCVGAECIPAENPTATSDNHHPAPNAGKQEFCMSASCIQAAGDILENMDLTQDPCVDFYEYACGGFVKNNFIPDDEDEIGQISKLIAIVDSQIKEILNQDFTPNDAASIKLAKDFYNSCMNTSQVEEDGLKPIKDIIEMVGGWPVVEGEDWDDNGLTWQKLMYKFNMANLSTDYFVKLSIDRDFQTGNRHILLLEPISDEESLRFNLKGKKRHKRSLLPLRYYEKTAVFYDADVNIALQDMEDVLDFETELGDLQILDTSSEEQNSKNSYNVITVGELQKISSEVNWTEYISTVLSYNINDTEPIVISSAYYIKALTKLLANTTPRVLANSAIGKIVRSLTPYVSKKFDQMVYNILEEMPDVDEAQKPSRWRVCLEQVSEYFATAIGQAYVQKYLKPEAKIKATEMVQYLRKALGEILSNVEWADTFTILRAKDKLANISPHVAYPDELLSVAKVNAEYENLAINKDTYFQNLRNCQILKKRKYNARLRQPVEKNSWKKSAGVAVVNAFYSFLDNSITLPAGLLQEVFFNHDRPHYMNFATIGTIVGHELTHGFDNRGRLFDENGHLKNWWREDTANKFRNREVCMVEQYNAYVSPRTTQPVDGFKTLGENIADNGGLKAAHLAYQRWSKAKGINELPLPGLNMTTNQLFWISYANVWCSKQRKTAEQISIATDEHAINRFRVNGPLSNMKSFAEDFKCIWGKPLNPVVKCLIW